MRKFKDICEMSFFLFMVQGIRARSDFLLFITIMCRKHSPESHQLLGNLFSDFSGQKFGVNVSVLENH